MSVFGLQSSVLGLSDDAARIEALAEQLEESGFGFVEIPFSRPHDVDPRRLRALGQRGNFELFLSLSGLPAPLDALARPQDALDFLDKVFPVCAEAGSFGLGGIVYDTPGRSPGIRASQKEIDALSRFLERAARGARGAGVKLGLAPGNRFETHLVPSAADAAWLIERVGAENLFLQLDTFSMNTEEEDWSTAFEAAAPFLGFVGLSESNRGVPGRGLLDWTAVFKALADIGAACPLVWRGTPLAELAAGRVTQKRGGESPDELLESGVAFLREKAKEAGLTFRR